MNLGQLKAAVREYAHRTISDDQWAMLFEPAEQRIYFGEANTPALRIAAMQSSINLTDGNVPETFLSAIKVSAAGEPLTYSPLDRLKRERGAFSWSAGDMVLSEDQAFPVSLIYYGRFAPLSSDGDVNWLTERAPGVYLTSVLIEFARWARDDVMGAREAANYASATSALMSSDRAASISGSRLVARVK